MRTGRAEPVAAILDEEARPEPDRQGQLRGRQAQRLAGIKPGVMVPAWWRPPNGTGFSSPPPSSRPRPPPRNHTHFRASRRCILTRNATRTITTDLPIPLAYALIGGVWALIVTFAVVAVAWRTPRFDPAKSESLAEGY
jgi:hypothetical protein